MAVVLVEHDIQLVMDVCTQIHVLDLGRVLASGTPPRCSGTRRCWPPTWERRVSALLSVRDLRAGYGPIEVLHGIDLDVPAGSVVAILGPNGAGKTTLAPVIAGLEPASGGSIVLAGRRVNGAEPTSSPGPGLPDPRGPRIFPNLTVHEHLRMATHSGRRLADIEAETFERFPRLAERRTQVAGTLSGGEQQMLALARASPPSPRC